MSDLFYRTARLLGRHVFWLSSRPVVLGVEHIPRAGPLLLASTHTSPYDIPLLMRHVPRLLDFVSIVEVFQNPFLAWLYGGMNAFPLDRHRPDAPTIRTILRRLERGRAITMFPEGGFRRGDASVIHSRKLRKGVGRLLALANVPVVPVVVINSVAYAKPTAWLPLRRTRYAVAFGKALPSGLEPEQLESALVESMVSLHLQAINRLPEECRVV